MADDFQFGPKLIRLRIPVFDESGYPSTVVVFQPEDDAFVYPVESTIVADIAIDATNAASLLARKGKSNAAMGEVFALLTESPGSCSMERSKWLYRLTEQGGSLGVLRCLVGMVRELEKSCANYKENQKWMAARMQEKDHG